MTIGNGRGNGREDHRYDRVLVVEGDPVLGEVAVQDLFEAGFTLDRARSGAAGLEALEREFYGVVLVDSRIENPDPKGLMTAGRLLHPATQFIALLPLAGGQSLQHVMSALPFACLRIPFQSARLQELAVLARDRARADDRAGAILVNHTPWQDGANSPDRYGAFGKENR